MSSWADRPPSTVMRLAYVGEQRPPHCPLETNLVQPLAPVHTTVLRRSPVPIIILQACRHALMATLCRCRSLQSALTLHNPSTLQGPSPSTATLLPVHTKTHALRRAFLWTFLSILAAWRSPSSCLHHRGRDLPGCLLWHTSPFRLLHSSVILAFAG